MRNKKVKKYLIKSILEFIVIVLGISVSFWVNNKQTIKQNKNNELKVYKDIKTELNKLSNYIEARTTAFNYDLSLIDSIYNNSPNFNFTYKEMLIAITDWRGFSPGIEIYSSLKYDGGLKYISNPKIKVAIDRFYAPNNAIYANMDDEVVVQREILKFLHLKYPLVLLNEDSNSINEAQKIEFFKKIIQNDLSFRSLLKAKRRFMKSKSDGIKFYKKSHQNLLSSIDEFLN
ncbi:MAG: Uncharacterised protein [Flavobacterium sp. SCGC AAA160-P02]|nr:MAG: Uncharacterised protein [Flavobacterium sp. SCGC AAA160-P02]|tara:strand:- start:4 stop:696 length:693 start_codon:yes stop_codon:yes gene_type:complete